KFDTADAVCYPVTLSSSRGEIDLAPHCEEPMRHRVLWIVLISIVVGSFTILGYQGMEVYRLAPPVPERGVTESGRVLYPGEQIKDGQNVWQSIGGQQVGSIWGHGAYVAPDWSADWLHREATWLLDSWTRQDFATTYEAATDEQKGALRARLA